MLFDSAFSLLLTCGVLIFCCCGLYTLAGHFTYQCRNFFRVNPEEDIVLDVSSTSSFDSEEEEIYPPKRSNYQQLNNDDEKRHKKKSKRKKLKKKKSKRKHRDEDSDSDSDKQKRKRRKSSMVRDEEEDSDYQTKHRKRIRSVVSRPANERRRKSSESDDEDDGDDDHRHHHRSRHRSRRSRDRRRSKWKSKKAFICPLSLNNISQYSLYQPFYLYFLFARKTHTNWEPFNLIIFVCICHVCKRFAGCCCWWEGENLYHSDSQAHFAPSPFSRVDLLISVCVCVIRFRSIQPNGFKIKSNPQPLRMVNPKIFSEVNDSF